LPLGGGPRQTLVPDAVSPTLSRDGRRLACVLSTPEGSALAVADAEGQNAQILVPPRSLEGIAAPRFSPDGRQIVFSAVAPMAPVPRSTLPPAYGGTRATPAPAPAPGTAPGRSAQRAAEWGAFARRALADLGHFLEPRPVEARGRPHGLPMDVFVVGATGGTPRRLTQLGEDSPSACWSPDGRRIAILAGGGTYVVDVDGGDLANVDQRGGHGLVDWRHA
jgi:Tol biopolymer transport system component